MRRLASLFCLVVIFIHPIVTSAPPRSARYPASAPAATTVTTAAPVVESEPEPAPSQLADAGQVVGGVAIAAAAAAPPPLPMMAPLGLPQPGAIAAGGGITPAVALTVNEIDS